eukprot:248098-Chlamydomonas_euryale.AAC.1
MISADFYEVCVERCSAWRCGAGRRHGHRCASAGCCGVGVEGVEVRSGSRIVASLSVPVGVVWLLLLLPAGLLHVAGAGVKYIICSFLVHAYST